VTNQLGARWTFLSRTHRPFLAAVLMALSAWANPSSDPMAIDVMPRPSSAAKSSTRPDASNPGTEHIRIGVPDFSSLSTMFAWFKKGIIFNNIIIKQLFFANSEISKLKPVRIRNLITL